MLYIKHPIHSKQHQLSIVQKDFDSNILGMIIEDAAMNRASYSLTVHADFEFAPKDADAPVALLPWA